MGQGKHLITDHLLLLFCNDFPPLRSHKVSYLILSSNATHTSSNFLSLNHVCGVSDSHVCGMPISTYVIKFGYFSCSWHLSYIDLIVRPAEST